jgi:hypothetical protein
MSKGPINSTVSFSADYREARAKFLDTATAVGGAIESIRYPEQGPDGDLYTDVARFGAPNADKCLVLISGTHGVEGFCGSGAQVDLLRRGEVDRLPADIAVLMIHAINPYGFAWIRRTTHENVDLNRNWVDFGKPLPVNAGYAELNAAIVPVLWTADSRSAADAVLAEYESSRGVRALQQLLGAGQYNYATGLYYGGAAPCWSRVTQTQILTQHLADVGSVGIVDYHSGLGPWGYAEQIVTCSRDSPAFRRASRWFGAAIRSTVDGTAAAARVNGDGLTAAAALFAGCEVTAMAFEVGTLPRASVLAALRADAWLHAHGDPSSRDAKNIKAQLRAAYYSDSDDWKGMVAGQSLTVYRQALAGLTHAKL